MKSEKYQLSGKTKQRKQRRGDQTTLLGEVAFNPEEDCKVCVAKARRRIIEGHPIPHRAHHAKCPENKKTKGKGELSQLSVAGFANDKRHKHMSRPIEESEKVSGMHCSQDAAASFFSRRQQKNSKAKSNKRGDTMPEILCKAVSDMVADVEFAEKHKAKSPPLAMLAFC